jgi:hypothetical protein
VKFGNQVLVGILAAICLLICFAATAGGTSGGSAFAMTFLVFIAALIYFIPSFIAIEREHTNTTAIVVVNVLVGWTLIGWVGSLVWALVRDRSAELLATQERERVEAAQQSRAQVQSPRDPWEQSAPAPAATKACPFCAEQILLAAIKCKHCGSDLPAAVA